MDIDELTVPHRFSGTPVYRLAGGAQCFFAHGAGARISLDEVWRAVVESLEPLDGLERWIGPLDARPRSLPADLGEIRAALERDGEEAMARFDAVTLRMYSQPDPPRQQLSLVLPAPEGRHPWGSLATGTAPSAFLSAPDAVVERMLRIAELLRPHTASAGLWLMSEPWMEEHHVASALPFLERHPGLNLPHRLEWGAEGRGIAGIDWLTMLGERPLELLGGADELRRRLAEAAARLGTATPEVVVYGGGALVRACQAPRLGDASAEGDGAPVEYRVVDAALRPLRWDGRSSRPNALLKVGSGEARAEATERWATRFERSSGG